MCFSQTISERQWKNNHYFLRSICPTAKISKQIRPSTLVAEIDYFFSAFDNILSKYEVEKIKTMGDAYMCVGGLPKPNDTHPIDVIKAWMEIRDFMFHHKMEKLSKGETPFEIRIGIQTVPVVAGIVGVIIRL